LPILIQTIPNIITAIMGGRHSRAAPPPPDYTSYQNQISQLQSQINNINSANTAEKQRLINEQNKLKQDVQNMMRQNENLNGIIMDLNKQISNLNDIAQKDMKTYISIKDYFNNANMDIKRNQGFAIIGPKGSGKSTFLWLRGLIPRPEKTTIDGTTEIINQIEFVDTIGINIELNLLIKLFAVLIVKGLPNTLVLCINDRIDRALLIFAHLLVTRMYIVMINSTFLHNQINKGKSINRIDADDIYNLETYKNLHTQKIPVIPVTHETTLDSIDTFKDVLAQLFPNNKISLPEWGEFSGNQNTITIIRYQICKSIYDYKTKFNSNERLFLNQID